MVEPILEAMMRDKKTIADRLHFVLPMGLGKAAVDNRAEPDMVRSELKALIEEGEPCREY
jgi:3-dehydroquinate synthetase